MALTLMDYNWEVDRGGMSRWWYGWVAELADGRCDFPLAMLSLLGAAAKQEGKIMLWSAHILEHITVHTMPLYWRKEIVHGRLGATLTLLGKM